MTLPTPYAVRVREPVAGPPDDFGNPTVVWTEADWPVHAIAPGAATEPTQSNRDLSVVAWTLLGPKVAGYPTSARAEVRLPGESAWLSVEGLPADWTLGPWDHPTAGIVVELRRADG